MSYKKSIQQSSNFQEKGFKSVLHFIEKGSHFFHFNGMAVEYVLAIMENLPLGITSQLGYGFLEHFY
jgi:hypothetical protein